jgi:photosystem II stability/assembly factor-like uncharacterized protein
MENQRRQTRELENQIYRNLPSPAKGPQTSPMLFSAAALSTTQWTPIGPQPTMMPYAFSPVSGRVTALAVDPINPVVVYLGSAEGGVWKTTDGGKNWTPLTDQQPSLAIGSLAIDPSSPQTIYAGTGEEDFALDTYYGAGILKSTDGGITWTQLAAPFAGATGSFSPDCGGATIGALTIDPINSQVLLAGAFFPCSSIAQSGIYRSTNGGVSWSEVLPDGAGTAVMFDPTGATAYAALGTPQTVSGGKNGIYKSTDGGQSWTGPLSGGLPTSNVGKIALAVAPSAPMTIYAGIADISQKSESLLGVFKTTDGGATWTQLTAAPDYCGPSGAKQCYFDNVIGVAPNNANVVLLGGSETINSKGYAGTIFLSLDGGSSWKDITNDSAGGGVHPDAHAIAFSADGSTMYVGTDGGAWSASLSGTGVGAWNNLNDTLALSQFYPGMSIDPTDPNNAFAGSQDNGSQEYIGNLSWYYIGCGDGGQTAFDYSDLNTLYIGCFYVPPNQPPEFLFRLTANPPTGVAIATGIDGSDPGWPIPPLTMDPSNPNTLYFGTNRVYQTTNQGDAWTAISIDLTTDSDPLTSTLSAIDVAPSDPGTVYAGTNDGLLWVTNEATTSSSPVWSPISTGTPNRSVTAIAADPGDGQVVYAAFSGFSGFSDALGHVFRSSDGGSRWTDISGSLPNIPVNDVVVDPDIANTIYIGTDIGVFEGTNPGTGWQWTPFGTSLPKVVIMSLKLQRASRILRAASYGRSAWDILLPTPPGPTAVLSTPVLSFASQTVGTTSAAQTVTLANNSSTTLAISSIAASGDFAETNTCGASLAGGANCSISVTFTPTASGQRAGLVTVSDNAASGTTQTAQLNGVSTGGIVSLNPATLSFGSQAVGTTSGAQTVTLTNNGATPLTITAITGATDFTTVNVDCPVSPSTLAAAAACHINVAFAPTKTGSIAEQVTVTDSAADSPQSVSVTGTGTSKADFTLAVASGSSSSATVSAGGAASYSLTVTPTGGFNQAVSLTCTGAPSKATCTVPASVTLDGTNAAKVTVSISTTAGTELPPASLPPGPSGWLALPWIGLIGLLAGAAFYERRSFPRAAGQRPALQPPAGSVTFAAAFGALLLFVALWTSCGGGPTPVTHVPGTPAGTYSLTVTATSGSLSHTTTLTLTVQ